MKHVNRFICLLFVWTILWGILPGFACAEELDSGSSARMTASGTFGEGLAWVLSEDGTLTISGNGAIPGGYFNQPWENVKQSITKISIGAGITAVGDGAFSNCYNLTSVWLPDSVQTIGELGFWGCSSLKEIRLPDTLTQIGIRAFGYCASLTNFTIPAGLRVISTQMLAGCTGLTEIQIPSWITEIRWGAFSGCTGLKSVKIPENITYLGGTFRDCTNLESVELPNSITEMAYQIFAGCTSLKSVDLPDNLQSIGADAFCGSGITELTIPATVSRIDNGAFRDCTGLKMVKIPENISYLGVTFRGCVNLESVELPNSVTEMAYGIFAGCTSLKSVDLPDNLQCIGFDAFAGSGITELTIPATVSAICNNAFSGCENLEMVKLPNGVTEMAYGVFSGCSSLKLVNLPENLQSIGTDAFAGSGITELAIPETVFEIGNRAFAGCTGLNRVYFRGNAPAMQRYVTESEWYKIDGTFCRTEVEAYYPQGNATWTEDNLGADYGGAVTWIPYTPPEVSGFTDVAENFYYAGPVLWAVNKGITNGLSADTFGPDATCTRAQIVTFLWRANGSPAPTSGNNPFTDVPAGQWYTDAVLWAVEKGITAGTSDTTFSPDAGCTRGQVATFLWRAEGEPASGAENIFTDIAPGAYYYNAVLWAVENGVTNGMGEGIFAPDATCTRGQIVTFLYRAME